MKFTPDILESLTMNGGRYYLPDNVRFAIGNCIESDDSTAIIGEYERLLSEYKSYITKMEPAAIDYRGSLTLDAYGLPPKKESSCNVRLGNNGLAPVLGPIIRRLSRLFWH